MKRLEYYIEKLIDSLKENDLSNNCVTAAYEDENTYIYVWVYKNKQTEVDVLNYRRDDACYPNIEAYIASCMPSYYEVEDERYESEVSYDEWAAHGFTSAAEYWQQRI